VLFRSLQAIGDDGQTPARAQTHNVTTTWTTDHGLAALSAGGTLDIAAGHHASFLGADLLSGADMALVAGGDLVMRARIATRQTDTQSQNQTGILDQPEGLFQPGTTQQETSRAQNQVGGGVRAGGTFTALSGNQLELTGIDLHAGDDVLIGAQRIVMGVNALESESHRTQAATLGGLPTQAQTQHSQQTQHRGTTIQTPGDLTLWALDLPSGDAPLGMTLSGVQLHGRDIVLATPGDIQIDSTLDRERRETSNASGTATSLRESARTVSVAPPAGGGPPSGRQSFLCCRW
jgi:hypothetical protein